MSNDKPLRANSLQELEVLHLIAKGKNNQHISNLLNIAERTVKFHANNTANI
jgi:DNA-binding NarL/FixJ family response regulator